MPSLDLNADERAVLIAALRKAIDLDPLSHQARTLKAILERLQPRRPQPLPDTASTG